MESNQEQDFGALLNNFSDSTPAGQSNTGNDFGSLLNQPSLPKPKQAATTAPIDSSKIDAIAQQESLTPTQKTVMAALLGQESGNGTNTVTSTDGARGAGQIMPATFTRYAKQGESIDNQDHNLAVMARIVKDLGNKFGDSPEKIATGYFSGEGNVNKGQGSAWKNDAADGNGKRVSSYVSDVLNRVGAIKPAQAQAPKEPPKWAEIEAKPEYAKLSDAEKIEAKNAYFDYYVAPHVGKDAEGLRKQFLEKDQESDGVLGTLRNLSAGVLKIGPTAVKGGADLVRLATGDKYGTGISEAMQTGMESIDQTIGTKRFNDQQKAFSNLMQDDTKSVGDMFSFLIDNPSIAVDNGITTIGSMFLPAGAAKTAATGAKLIGAGTKTATKAAIATSIGASVAQNAADTFDALKDKPIENRYQGAAISAAVSILSGIATGGGAEAAIAKKLAGDVQSGKVGLEAVKSFLKSAFKEGAQESGEEVGNIIGESVGNEAVPNMTNSAKRTAFAGTLGAAMGGGTDVFLGSPDQGGAVVDTNKQSITTDGRIEPDANGQTPTPAELSPIDVHPTTAAADQVVSDLVDQYGVPDHVVASDLTPQQNTGKPSYSDDDVVSFADSRYEQLLAKRDGTLETVMGDDGKPSQQEIAGSGLSPAEVQELNALEQAQANPQALRKLYGFDQSQQAAPAVNPTEQPTQGQSFPNVTEPALSEMQNEESNRQTEEHGLTPGQDSSVTTGQPSGATVESQQTDNAASTQNDVSNSVGNTEQQDSALQASRPVDQTGNFATAAEAKQFISNQRRQSGGKLPPALPRPFADGTFGIAVKNGEGWDDALAHQEATKPKTEKQAKEQRQNGQAETQVQAAQAEQAQTQESEKPATVKPRTEKEARAQKDYSDKWFGTSDKAQAFIDKQGIGDSHAVVNEGKRFLIKPKVAETAPAAQTVEETATSNQPTSVEDLQKQLRDVERELDSQGAVQNANTRKRRDDIATAIAEAKHPEILKAVNNQAKWADSVANAIEFNQDGDKSGAINRALKAQGVVEPSLSDMTSRVMKAIGETENNPTTEQPKQTNWKDTLTTARNYANGLIEAGKVSNRDQQRLKDHWGNKGSIVDIVNKVESPEYQLDMQAEKPDVANEQKPTASTNTVFTDDAAEKARALLRSKLGQLNSGIDPEVMQAGITLAGYHIEKGARTFAAYSKAMLEDMGDIVKPYLKSWYLGVKFDPRAAGFTGMDDAGVVEKADIDAPVAKAENEQKPQESGNDTRANQATSEGDSGNRADDQSRSGQENQESVANPASEDVGKATTGRDDQRPSTDSASGDVGSGGSVRKSRTPANGRKGTSGTRLADDGAREERGNADVVESQRANYHIDDPDTLIGGTPKIRFARNKKAIEAYQSITSEGRAPTQDELDSMAAYIGWGSFGQELFQGTYEQPRPKDGWKDESDWLREHLGKADWESAQKSIINAHYTDPITVGSMWDMVRQLGFTQGRVLEPSMGIGNFYGLMPKDLAEQSQLTGIEMDSLTGGMAKVLYPDANIQIKPYQDSKTADGFYDLVIGNWPFAKDGPADRRYMRLSPSLHDYFFLKALDQVRAGGLVVGITSAGTMDKKGTLTRAALAEKADLVAAFRLPSGAFEKYAGTSVVTDIIILKKRDTPNADVKASGWLNTAEVNTPSGNKVTVNEYFANNPDRVLGTLNFSHGSTYGRPAMVVNRPDDLEARLKGLAKTLPAGVFEQVTTKAKTTQYITNNTTDRQQSITEQSGKLYQVQGEYLAPLDDVFTYKVKDAKTTANRLQQIKDLIGMRRAYGELIDAERNGDENTEAKRKALRQAYEAFTRANGSLIGSYGLSALKKVNDPFYPSLAALEMPDGSPSAILSKPTIRAKRRLDKPTVRDALVLARNESIYLSMDRVAELSGVPVDEAAKELIDAGAIFKTPDGNYEVSDVYLSGNVRRKLREAQDAADQGVDMKRNIEALTDVLPQDVPYFNIEPKLGATWIRPEQYGEFIAHLLGVKPSDDIQVRWAVNRWKVSFHDKSLNNKPEATTTWGHTGVKFDKLLNAAMGNVAVKVQYKDEDGNLQTDEVATAEANNKAQQIREEFANWLWSDPVRKIEMERTYNEVMNAIALPKYDGSFLSFEGMALQRGDSPFNLRKHQIDAIWRGLANGRSLNAHEVGTGKTYTMGGLAVESRRYGIAKKPIIFAHNANSASVAREIGEMYPGAKLLYIDNLAPDKIGVTLRQIQTDDWDAVVVPHSLIDRFTLKKETLMDISREQIEALEQEAIEAAQEDGSSIEVKDMDDPDAMKKVRSATAKQLVHARNAIIKKIDDMAMRSSREDAISFEDMGIDMVIVDEAHEFKKPPLATRMRMKGLNTQSSAQSISLVFLTDYVKKLNNGSGVHLFTGTPITNTMTEIYNMMRYVMDDQMSRDGIRDWDAWFNTFADSTSDVELTAAGDYEPVTRLASFVNVAELRRMIGQYMDIVFADDMPEFKPRETKNGKTLSSASITDKERNELLNGRTENPIGRPYKKVVSDIAEMTDQQKGILALLQQRANTFKRATKKERREMMLSGSPNSPVIVETDSANAGLDARLFDIESGDAPTSKVNRAVKRIMEHYNEHDLATQVVFVERGFTSESVSRKKDKETGKVTSTKKERFNLVKDLVAKLVDQGVPVNQIAIVDGSTSKEKRKAIADAMNRAEIRVVIGNTKTLGVGVNMQTNLRAMHHLDAPWMPGDLEQRNGRGHRQGNKWNTVMEYRYLTERIDGRRWQVLAVKDRFIKAFLKAKDDVRVIDGDAVSMDEEGDIGSTLAEAAGDPRLLMMNKLRGDVQKLETKERMHSQGVFDAAQKIKSLNRDVENYSTRLDALRADDESFRKVVKDGLSVEVANKLYDDAEKANEAIAKQIERMEVGSKATKLGTAWGFDIYGYWPGRAFNAQYYIESGKNRYDMGKPTVESARATLYAIKGQAEKLEGKIADAKDSLPRMEEATKAPFARAADLEKKRGMLAAIETDIQINPVPAPAWLRNGAPAGSEAFVGGKPVVVEGHRWTNDGYLVTVTEGEKTNDVDYLDVKDENGLPIYDVQPFAIPEIAKPAEQEATTFNNLNRNHIPETLSIDGVDRPTRNSNGQFIYQTEEGIRNFWRWFGDSKVVDAEGKPLVMFHGTQTPSFSEFQHKNYQNMFGVNDGFYFADSPQEASKYAGEIQETLNKGRRGFGAVKPVYLRASKLADVTDSGWNVDDINVQEFRENQDHDGLLAAFQNKYDAIKYDSSWAPVNVQGNHILIFDPSSIKSAIGNNGEFNPNNPSIIANLMRSPASGVSTAPEQVRVNARTKLKSLEKRRDEGKLTEAEYRLGVQQVIAKLEQREEAKIERRMESGRRRGADWIMAQLRKGVANDTVPRVEAEFAQWLLDQNPQLADDLGISITGKDGNGSAGQYNDITKVIKLFSAGLGDGTVVHEILHHIERMMPRDVQDGILKAWRKAWNDAYKSAKPEVKKGMDIMLAAALGDKAAYDSMVELFQNGTLDYDTHYQLFSPSEFWAVNATKILSGRFNANGSWTKKAAQWLREFVQRVKGLLGLQSDAPILKALNAVMKGDGTFQSSRMLGNRINEGEGVLAADLDRGVEYNNIIRKVQNNLVQFYDNRGDKNLDSWNSWDRSLATQFHKALKDKHYGKVFALINAMQNEVSLTSIRPAELAPGVLPRVDDIRSAWDVLRKGKKMDSNLDAASKAIFAGTLAGASVMEGKVWTDEELRNTFKLNDAGVALYRQTRAAIDASLDETAAAEAYAMAQGFIPKAMRRMVIDNPRNAENILTNELDKQISMLEMAVDAAKAAGNDTQVASFEESLAAYHETVDRIAKIFNTSRNLKAAGYAPLMRFGRYEVTAQLIDPETGKVVRDENGESITLFYSQYETQGEAKAAYKQKQAEFADRDDVRLSQGRKSEMSHELYSGISPETLALFAEAVGLDKTTKQFYQNALTERSALKRRLERKGTAGYSSDMPRVLSNFITSNGRFAAQRYYLRDINNSIKYIPKEKGDVKDEAIKIKNFILNPNDPAAPVSAALFAWFLGGSVASAVVNLSQPVMMTGPYLSQYGVSEATSAMAKALPIALGKKQITDHVLKEALKRAGQEGIVDAQEIFHLYSIGAQNVASGLVNALSKLPGVGNKIKAGGEDARARANAFLTLWGSMFAMAESFNRKLTFVAAWDVAKATGKKDPYAFAVRAVNETQGIYNKVNRPNWARGPVGRTVLTFKQYSIMYVELLSRLAKHGGPEGKRAALMMLAVLMLASGEEGLPFSQDLDDLIDTIGQILGYDTNARRWKRRNAYEIFGKEMGDLSLYGISSMLPMDFSNRLGLGNLIPGTGLIKASDENNQSRNIEEIFGAGAGMLGQMGDAVNAAIDRNWGKAAQNIMPTAIKNLSGGLEMAKKGYATDSRGRKVVETTGVESVGKMLGFNPTVVAQETRRTAPQQQDIALQKRTEASITDLWAQGMADNDQEAMDKAAKRLDDWNRDNPDTPIRISPDQIRDKKRKLLQDKESRLIKSAPRELRARIGLELTK